MQPGVEDLNPLSSILLGSDVLKSILNTYGILGETVLADLPHRNTTNVDEDELITLAILWCRFFKLKSRVANDSSSAMKSMAFVAQFILPPFYRFETDSSDKVKYIQ